MTATFVTCPACGRMMLGQDRGGYFFPQPHQCQEAEPEPEAWGGGCECWVTPEHMWTAHYGAVEPGSQIEYNPDGPEHGDRPCRPGGDLNE